MTNPGFNPVDLVIEVSMKSCTQMNKKAKQQGKFFIIALDVSSLGATIEPKCV